MKYYLFVATISLSFSCVPTSSLAAKACKISSAEYRGIDSKSSAIDSVVREDRDEQNPRIDGEYILKDGTTLEFSAGGCDELWSLLEWHNLKAPVPQTQEQWLTLLTEKLKAAPLNQVGDNIFDRAIGTLDKMDRKKILVADELGWSTILKEAKWACFAAWGGKRPGIQIQCKRSAR